MAKRTDVLLGLILVAVAGGWITAAYLTIPEANIPGTPGPQAFPLLLGLALALLGGWLAVSGLLHRTGGEVAAATEQRDPGFLQELKVVGTGFGLLLVYGFGMDKLGFLLITPPVVIVVLRLFFRERSWRKILANAVGLSIGVYLVFDVLLQAHLPKGDWIQLF